MLRSVRAGGLAAAVFLTSLFGAPAQSQVVHAAPADTPVQVQNTVFVSQPVVAAPAPEQTVQQVQPQQTAPSVKKGQSLQQLATTLASSQTNGADHECLATAVYFEARGESLDGQLAVAEVVLNRSRSGRYPPDVCAVVKQPAQFSFVRKGQFPAADRGSAAWKKAVAIAKVAQDKLATKLSKNVLWYHADYVAPSWGKRLSRQAQIGTHIFYS